MKIYDHPMGRFVCPICGMKSDRPVTLIGVDDGINGGVINERQFHVHCIKLVEYTGRNDAKFIAQWL